MQLIKAVTEDFDRVKSLYMDIIDNGVDIYKYSKWEYGKHPNDESIRMYIENGYMHIMMDGQATVGAIVITPFQEEEYHPVKWQIEAADDEVAVLHLLGVAPKYQGQGIARQMITQALAIASDNGMKCCRLDALCTNIPAHCLYEKMGFVFCGKQHWYAENTGWLDFYLYEYVFR